MNCPGYPSIFTIGHRTTKQLFDGERQLIVEEKVDGSQFTFGIKDGELRMRSKGAEVHELTPEKMFSSAVATVQELKPLLNDGWLYRGEYLKSPKHNVLIYSRIPNKHIILFDITREDGVFLTPEEKQAEAARLGLEVVRTYYVGAIANVNDLRLYLDSESALGGQKVEGVVVKPLAYDVYGTDKKVVLAKFVSEAFKEVHQATWTKDHRPAGGKDIVALIGATVNTQARWQKALIHAKEEGKIEGTPRDIGLLIGAVTADVSKEETENIKQQLFDWAWPQIRRMSTAGLAEWYKEELIKDMTGA